ncbi:DUF6169 family protein [Flavipsychrobacter stenotrophus]|nr:DUF6169 family protein [Flavipsychrobacter stenotrophus]
MTKMSFPIHSSQQITHYVYFDPYQYVDHIDNYPALLRLGYGFGFQRMSIPNTFDADPLVGKTISRIIFDFIEERSNEVVLLYHCEYIDKKQKGRDRIFQEWYDNSPAKELVIKKRIEINQTDSSGNRISFFMGYLVSGKNRNKLKIDEEFSTFADKLIAGKP